MILETNSNDYIAEQENLLFEVEHELKPIQNFLEYRENPFKISLKKSISFKEFNKFFPEITKKQLVSLFDFLEENSKTTLYILKRFKKWVMIFLKILK